MQSSPVRFAEILTTSIKTIALKGRSIEAIQDELGYALGREGGSFIRYLRKGNLPANRDDVLALARELIRLKGLTSVRDCELFLESAGISHPKDAARKLWVSFEGSLLQLQTADDAHAFIVGPPVLQPRQFFGRAREVERIFAAWRAAPLMHITLIGPRRSGKTSLLHYLHTITVTSTSELRRDQRTDWLPEPHLYRWVWVDFQDPRMRVRERLLRHLLTGCGIEAPQPCTLEIFADAMDNHGWETPCIVLMDELGRGLSAPELDQDFWHCLRSLMNTQTQGQLGFLLSSHEAPQQLAEDRGKTSPFFNMFQTLELGPFTEAETLELIVSSPIAFPTADVAWIANQSGRWPILVQILCQARLMALQRGEPGEDWREVGLHHILPFRYLLDSRHG